MTSNRPCLVKSLFSYRVKDSGVILMLLLLPINVVPLCQVSRVRHQFSKDLTSRMEFKSLLFNILLHCSAILAGAFMQILFSLHRMYNFDAQELTNTWKFDHISFPRFSKVRVALTILNLATI